MQVVNNLFAIEDINSPNEVKRGETVKRKICIKNRGSTTDVDIWIHATDAKSEPILRWYDFAENNPFTVEDKKEITLKIDVPQQATPGVYSYDICLEAALVLPGRVFRLPQQLRVLQSDQDAKMGSEPGFSIQPVTNPNNPHKLEAGKYIEFAIAVENRSKQTDRFFLNCPELKKDWFTVIYPESRTDTFGLVRRTEGLQLNPNDSGVITLKIHPPKSAEAGNYFPTVRLTSRNKQELKLLDIVYLEIIPKQELDVQIHPPSRKLPKEIGEFQLEIKNEGNIHRSVAIRALDKEDIFHYRLEPNAVNLAPGEKKAVTLKVRPAKFWRRSWRDKSLEVPFDIELEDTDPLIIGDRSAAPQKLAQANLMWEPYPWWYFWVLVSFLLLLLGGTAFLIWLNFQKPPLPRITEVKRYVDKNKNQEEQNDEIRLTWTVDNSDNIEKITLIRFEGNVESDRKNYLLNDNSKLAEFQKICGSDNPKKIDEPGNNNFDIFQVAKFIQPKKTANTLICKIFQTGTVKPGKYTFKLEVYPKNSEQPASSQTTDAIEIPAVVHPLPQIVDFSSSQATYEELDTELNTNALLKPSSNNLSPAPIILNWKINNPKNLQEIKMLVLTPDNSTIAELKQSELAKRCRAIDVISKLQQKDRETISDILECKNINTGFKAPGDYVFKLVVIPKGGQEENAIVKQTPTVKIQPLPLPEITNFTPAQPNYQEAILAQTASGILINWSIANPYQTKEIQIVGLAADGSISTKQQVYPIRNKTLPDKLKTFCTMTPKSLDCAGVPTGIVKAGNYTFKMVVVPKSQDAKTEIAKTTDAVKVEALPIPQVGDISIPQPSPQQNNGKPSPIKLNLNLANPSQIKQVKITALDADGAISGQPKILSINDLKRQCQVTATSLNCKNLTTDVSKPGRYTFKIAIASKGGEPGSEIVKTTDAIKIPEPPPVPVPPPPPLPQIANISTSKPSYQIGGTNAPPIRLNLNLTNPNQIKEVRIVPLGADGSISGQPLNLSINKLKGSCQATATTLNCQNLPTDITQPGNYTFRVAVIPKQAQPGTEIVKSTDAIKIQPPPEKPATPIKIISFKVNDEEVSSNPKRLFVVNKQRTDRFIRISWQVQDGEDIRVELIPAPGVVLPTDSRRIALSQAPSNETITLRVTNKAGQQMVQSVVIQTLEPAAPSQTPSGTNTSIPNSGNKTPGNNSSPATFPTPSSDGLSPMELPPQAN